MSERISLGSYVHNEGVINGPRGFNNGRLLVFGNFVTAQIPMHGHLRVILGRNDCREIVQAN